MSALRVAFFVNQFPILSEAFILNSAAALLDDGAEVDIYALEGRAAPSAETHPVIASHGLERRVSAVERPTQPGARVARAPHALGRAAGALGWRALSAFHLEAHGARAIGLHPLYEAAAFRHGGRYDILHCQFSTLTPRVLRHRRAGALSGRVVAHFRGYDITDSVRRHGPQLHAETMSGADWFIANCRYFAGKAEALGADPARLSVVYTGVEPSRFAFRLRAGPARRRVRLLGVGRLVEKKGFVYAVRALAQLVASGIDAELRLIGDGPEGIALAREIAAHGLEGRVALLGARGEATIAAELEGADIFIAPCVTGADGAEDAPINTIKEAMCAGLPVIATRHGGVPELVTHDVTGLLAPERDADALAKAVRALLAAPQDWPRLTRAARTLVEQRFSMAAAHQALREAYESARAAPRIAA